MGELQVAYLSFLSFAEINPSFKKLLDDIQVPKGLACRISKNIIAKMTDHAGNSGNPGD